MAVWNGLKSKLEVRKWKWQIDSMVKKFDYKNEKIEWYLERDMELIQYIF